MGLDRLSRTAGDVGSVVDLMNQKHLIEIRYVWTAIQKFTEREVFAHDSLVAKQS